DLRVTLLESRPRLAGRAGSFTDPATQELVDNCQHVSMGCCTNLADFSSRVGIRHLFREIPAINFLDARGRLSILRGGSLPAPFHLVGGFARAKYLTWSDKARVARGLLALRYEHIRDPSESFGAWLLRHGQNARTLSRFWGAVLVSALNEQLENL